MRILILGGGDVGLALGSYLANDTRTVVLLDPDSGIVERADSSGVTAHAVDITNVRELGDHDIEGVDVAFIASESDSANLLAAQLLRVAFGVERVVIRVNDPRNYGLFETLDVVTVCASSALAEAIAKPLGSCESPVDRPPKPA